MDFNDIIQNFVVPMLLYIALVFLMLTVYLVFRAEAATPSFLIVGAITFLGSYAAYRQARKMMR